MANSTPPDSKAPEAPQALHLPVLSDEPAPAKGPPGAKRKPKGAPLAARKSIQVLRWLRRLSQASFLVLFFYFLIQTSFHGGFSGQADAPVRLPAPVEGFFLFNPFVALLTLLSTHTLYRGLLWSLVVVGLVVVFGRVFCGWICPMGTLHHIISWVSPSRRGSKRIEANRTHPGRQRLKYYLLYGALVMALFGSALGGIFDPFSVLVRSLGLSFWPASQYLTGQGVSALSDSHVGFLQKAGNGAYSYLARTLWQPFGLQYHGAWLIGGLFIAVLVMNRVIPRFWCRVLCPLGALLGVMSRFALFGMEKDNSRCTNCNLCLRHCQGADSPQGGVKWRQDECHMCLNCENACPEDVIKFRFLPGRQSTENKPDTKKRTVLATAALGAAAVPLLRTSEGSGVRPNPRLIRPPGSLEEKQFLDRCIRCGECMKVCPNNALHPALWEAGVEGLWTPLLIPRIGYCEHSCVLCGQVCPTGAIQKITEKQKLGTDGAPIKLGTAFYNQGRCLPWAMQTPCIVCEEFCPTSPKAIWVEEVEVPLRSSRPGPDGAEPAMKTVKVKRPHVDPGLCIGCGSCEKVCPVQDQAAIQVSSVGESRSKTNVIMLENLRRKS